MRADKYITNRYGMLIRGWGWIFYRLLLSASYKDYLD